MSEKKEILRKIKEAVIELDEDEANRLVQEGLGAKLSPMEIILEGLSPGLAVIGEGWQHQTRFMGDLVLAGEIMIQATEILRPELRKGAAGRAEDIMVIGTVEGDQHMIGKRVVSAMFAGAGFRVIDIGENVPASEFVKATKEHKATVVGASAILGGVKYYCKVINDALEEAGLRDKVIYCVGGWGMSQEWSDKVGADCFGAENNAIDAVNKVKMIRAGELPKLKQRLKA